MAQVAFAARASAEKSYAELGEEAYAAIRKEEKRKYEVLRREREPVEREDRDVSAVYGLDQFNCRLLRAQFSDEENRRAASFAEHVKIVLRERKQAWRWIDGTDEGRLDQAIATAEGFRLAIEALPVGRDIRGRLVAHLDAHIAALRSEAR